VSASDPPGLALARGDAASDFELFCLALRRRPDPEEALRRALAAGPNWTRLVAGARRHLVEPLLLAGLRAGDARRVPPDVLAELRRRSAADARRTLAQIADIDALSRAFGRRGVRFLVLKGVALSAQLYGDAGRRGGRDIDLLIEPDGFAGAHAVMTEAGYRRRIDQLSARQTEEYRRRIKDVEYVHAVTQAHIELHYRLTDNEHLLACDFEALWREREMVQAGGAAIPTLPRRRLALYLLAHGAAHAWERLRWLVDLAELLREPGAVDAALEAADAAGLGPAMLHALALAHDWLGLGVAERHLVRARASARVRRLDRILMHLYAGEAWHEQPSHGTRQALARYSVWARLYRFSLKPGWRYWTTQAMREWFTPADWSTLPLPDAMFRLYPLLRPAGWLVRRWRR
jgi:putative nucleotidyltransferase-like protein